MTFNCLSMPGLAFFLVLQALPMLLPALMAEPPTEKPETTREKMVVMEGEKSRLMMVTSQVELFVLTYLYINMII
jgi:hypothetical protein